MCTSGFVHFFLRIALAILGLLQFHTNLIFFCSISLKNAIGILIEIPLHLYIGLGNMAILCMLTLSIHELEISSFLQFLKIMSYSLQCI